MSDLERIIDEFCDSYLSGDASWAEALSKDELVELMHQLWPIMRKRTGSYFFLTEECKPYYEKVAKKLAQDRINQGEA